jgi:uncharacterized membrane protein (DUF4010 family)
VTSLSELLPLLASTAIGLLIGTERGWRQRTAAAGTRAAGVRTFTLIGLLAGLAATYAATLGPAIVIVGFASIAAIVAIAYYRRSRKGGPQDATTDVAALVTYALALGPPLGHGMVCGAAAVVVAMLLGWKQRIHGVVEKIEERELHAAFQLLGLAFLLLPLLPDEGLGPWQAINLRDLLWMVLLIAGLGFVGYATMRRVGPRAGLAVTAIVGGLASSTAVTLDFARRAREHPTLTPLLAAGIVGAGGTMFTRKLVLLAFVAPGLLPVAGPALAVTMLACWARAVWTWRTSAREKPIDGVALRNPLQLGLALKFALLLAFVSLAAAALRAWMGESGIYLVSVVAGLADVDALVLALARQTGDGLPVPLAVQGVLIACAVDTLLKAGLAFGIGGPALGWRVLRTFLFALALGAAAFWLTARWLG